MHAGTKQVKQVCEIILCKEIEITKAAVKGRMMLSNGMQIRKKKENILLSKWNASVDQLVTPVVYAYKSSMVSEIKFTKSIQVKR